MKSHAVFNGKPIKIKKSIHGWFWGFGVGVLYLLKYRPSPLNDLFTELEEQGHCDVYDLSGNEIGKINAQDGNQMEVLYL